MIFKDAWVFLLLPAVIGLVWITLIRLRRGFLFPDHASVRRLTGGLRVFIARNRIFIRAAALICVIVALSRPQLMSDETIRKEGITIVLALDTSSTMAVKDVRLSFSDLAKTGPSRGEKQARRIDAAKVVAADFVASRANDMVGVIAFAAEAYVLSPLTFDQGWLLAAIKRAEVGMIKDGTAIGSGILASLRPLRGVTARSKVVILLTDGINNFGKVPPIVAAKAARALGVKIYTIGLVGKTHGLISSGDGTGRKTFAKGAIEVDEDALRRISALTDGKYFRATDMDSLRKSYMEIDRLETAALEQKDFDEYDDIYPFFLIAALLLLAADMFLGQTLFRRLP